jgi:hypothetical protein
MDIEWAKDGLNQLAVLFRPTRNDLWRRQKKFGRFTNLRKGQLITKGIAG